MKIYRENALVRDLTIDENTTILRRLMVENSLNLRVAVARKGALGLKIGDYTDLGSERYVIMDEPTYTLRGGVYDYTVLLRGALHRLEVYTMPDEGRDEWWYYGSVVDQINRVMAALNTKEAGWTVQLPDLTKISDNSPKNINYANMSILSAFHAICSAESGWGLEFDVLPGRVVRFDREIKNPTAHTFEYGRGLGLYEMTRGALSGEKIATRIIGYGGTANMLNGARLSFAPINGGFPYIEKNVDLYGLREERVNFDHIYPRRNASITSDAVQVEEGKANWTVADTTLDFNLTDQLIEGAVIMFNMGECVGVEFEIVSYDHATKTITFKENVDEGGGLNGASYVLPNADRKPKAGDAYVLVNIVMPDSYTTAAQRELMAATEDYASKKSTPQRSYTVTCDPRVFRVWNYTPFAGDGVRIVDAPNGVDYSTRIIGVEYPVIAPDKVKLTLADKVPIPGAVVMARSIKEVKTKMAMLDHGQMSEERLRQIFHPLGGSLGIPFAAKKVIARDFTTPELYAAMLGGYGGGMLTDPETGETHLWVDCIHARQSFETLELRFRKMLVSGEELVVNNGGKVSGVHGNARFLQTLDGRYIHTQDDRYITLKGDGDVLFTIEGVQDVDLQQFTLDDILRYTWRDAQTGTRGGSGYLVVTGIVDDFTYTARVVLGSPENLKIGMTVALFGNLTDKTRQGFIVLSARERTIAIFDGVDSHVMKPSNLKLLAGNLNGVVKPQFPGMKGYGLMSENCFLSGTFVLASTGQDVGDGLKTISTSVTMNEREIVLQAKSIKEVGGRVEKAEASIKVTAEEIALKVSKDGVMSAIEQSAEQIKISAGKLKLEGYTSINNGFAVDAQGNTWIRSGTIGGFSISNGILTGSSDTNAVIRFQDGGQYAGIGANILPVESGMTCNARFESHSYGNNAAIYASARNGQTNDALYMTSGTIGGYAVRSRRITEGLKLEHADCHITCYNTSNIEVQLPLPQFAQVGKVYYIRRMTNAEVTIACRVGNIHNEGEVDSVSCGKGPGDTAMLINDGRYWCYNYMIRN